ncbi:unnamed protein product [Ascophyllum nodosum]
MYAVIGLVILMGLQPFAEIRCHWDTRVMYDFPHVRECMTRNFFFLSTAGTSTWLQSRIELRAMMDTIFCITSGIRRNSKHGVEHVLSPWEVDFVRRANGCEQGAIQQGCAAIHAKQTH